MMSVMMADGQVIPSQSLFCIRLYWLYNMDFSGSVLSCASRLYINKRGI